jgi:hypothetical protein
MSNVPSTAAVVESRLAAGGAFAASETVPCTTVDGPGVWGDRQQASRREKTRTQASYAGQRVYGRSRRGGGR